MNENEIDNILELIKKKIAISQFKEENKQNNILKKEKRFNMFKKISIVIASSTLFATSAVGAYVGITGNTEILKNIGINIGEHYEDNKQEIEGKIYGNGFMASLVSATCDSTCIVLEIDFKLDKNMYNDINFDIDNLTFISDNFEESTKNSLNLSEDSASYLMEDGTIKLFKYISVKDPNLEADGFLSEVFAKNNKVNCIIEFSKIYDKKSKEKISDGNWNWKFTLNGDVKSQFIEVYKEIQKEDVIITLDTISKSTLGNYISLVARQNNFDINKENNIQKIKYVIKNSEGVEINIISRTYNITVDNTDGLEIALETTLKLDDMSDDINYDIDFFIGDEINVETSEIEQSIHSIEILDEEISEFIEYCNAEQEQLLNLYSKWDNSSVPQELKYCIGKNYFEIFEIRTLKNDALWLGMDSLTTEYILYARKIYALLFENLNDKYIITNILTTDIDPTSLGEKIKDDGEKVFITVTGEHSDYTDNGDGTYSITENDITYTFNTMGVVLYESNENYLDYLDTIQSENIE